MRMRSFGIKRLRQSLSRRDWWMLGAGAILALVMVGAVHLIQQAQTPLRPQTAMLDIPWLPSTVTHWQTPIDQMGKKYNIDPNLIAIIMTLESGGYAHAKSGSNAYGLMQVTTPTAKDIAAKFLKTPGSSYDLYDPQTSIEFGTAYLAYLRDQFGTAGQGPSWNATVELIAAGYNGGPGAANRLEAGRGLEDTQTVVYSRNAFNMWRERHAGDSPTFDRWRDNGGSILIDMAKAKGE